MPTFSGDVRKKLHADTAVFFFQENLRSTTNKCRSLTKSGWLDLSLKGLPACCNTPGNLITTCQDEFMTRERPPFLLRFMYNRPGIPWLAIFILGSFSLSLVGCTSPSVTDWRGSKYYYNLEKCPWQEGWMEIIEQNASIQVLPWMSYRKAAWAHAIQPDSLGFQQGWAIWIKEGFQLDTLFHEISHIHDWHHGRTGHNPECWMTHKPYGYDSMVLLALGNQSGVSLASNTLNTTPTGTTAQASLKAENP